MLNILLVDRELQTATLLENRRLAWLAIFGGRYGHDRAWPHLNALFATYEQQARAVLCREGLTRVQH